MQIGAVFPQTEISTDPQCAATRQKWFRGKRSRETPEILQMRSSAVL